MGIYQTWKADVWCDGCRRYLGEVHGAAVAIERLSSLRITCSDCGASTEQAYPES